MSQRLLDESFQQLSTHGGAVWNDWMPENIFISEIIFRMTSSKIWSWQTKGENWGGVLFWNYSCKHGNPSLSSGWQNARSNLKIASVHFRHLAFKPLEDKLRNEKKIQQSLPEDTKVKKKCHTNSPKCHTNSSKSFTNCWTLFSAAAGWESESIIFRLT